MNRNDIILHLNQNHSSFIDFIYSLDDADFIKSMPNKWSAGQQLEHILLSIKPLEQALKLPGFMLRVLFGNAKRSSLPYEDIVGAYLHKLANGAKATPKYLPAMVVNSKKEALINDVQRSLHQLTSLIGRFKEEELDSLVLPHPLLGKLTLREMLYFTLYHVTHHEKSLRDSLGLRSH